MPFMCRRFAQRQDPTPCANALSALGVRLACDGGLAIADWGAAACANLNQSAMLPDALHFRPAGSAIFAATTRKAAMRQHHDARACSGCSLGMQCKQRTCLRNYNAPFYALPNVTLSTAWPQSEVCG